MIIIAFIIAIILSSGISVFAYNYYSKDVAYKKQSGTQTNVETALNELYSMRKGSTGELTFDGGRNSRSSYTIPQGVKEICEQ